LDIRARYAALVVQTGLTQDAIAERGGLKGQGTLSKLLANTNLGPSVETFVRAVIGTGTKVSVFFAAIERGEELTPTATTRRNGSAFERLHELEMACAALAALLSWWSNAAATEADGTSATDREGGAHGDQSPLSDRSLAPPAELDLRRVEAIVQASTARILADIALLEQRVATGGGRSGVVPAGAPKP
jgi:transcriptional regulator with XRE-family HTH domain